MRRYNPITQRNYGRPENDVSIARNAINQILKKYNVNNVLIACSGGADSMALSDSVIFLATHRELKIHIVMVDHQINKNTSIGIKKAKQWLEQKKITIIYKKIKVPKKGGIETQARKMRYKVFEEAYKECGAELIFTGHHKNDQAETVLMSLMNGSGPRSLAGIPSERMPYIRPFLDLSKEQIYNICSSENIPYWEDSTNKENFTPRNIIRNDLFPTWSKLLEFDIISSLNKTSKLCREEVEAIDFFITQALSNSVLKNNVDISKLAKYPAAIRKGVLKQVAKNAGANRLNYYHLKSLDTLITQWHGQDAIVLPGKINCLRVKNTLYFKHS